MAYISTETVAAKRAALKAAFPGWTFAVSKHHHSSINVAIMAAPYNLLDGRKLNENAFHGLAGEVEAAEAERAKGHSGVNPYSLERSWTGQGLADLQKICAIVNEGNHDRSDPSTDYFDVGFYTHFSIGRWDKPFVVKAAKPAAKAKPVASPAADQTAAA